MGEQKDERQLRASEFAATLNGDNPQAILRVLRQFVKTVRHERRLALSANQYVDDDDSSAEGVIDSKMSLDSQDAGKEENDDVTEDDRDATEPPTKKYKKSEQWKMDIASYHVPFVGTAVARGELAPVRKGEWPTGVLKAYLEKSPMATELLNDDLKAPEGQIHKSLLKKRQGRLSTAICKAHLLALVELLTAAVPKERLGGSDAKRKNEQNRILETTEQTKFLPGFVKGSLAWVFAILNDETGRGRGKVGERGGSGPLIVPAIRILQTLAVIAPAHARHVARLLDENLSEGVLRVCLRPLSFGKGDDATEKLQESSTIHEKKPSRTGAIVLASLLLQNDDPVVNTYICTGGSREHKIKTGLVFIALREGLEAQSQKHATDAVVEDDDYLKAVRDLLKGVRHVLFEQTSRVGSNNKINFEMISKDPLQHLSRLASHAPRIAAENDFYDVLNSKDQYVNVGALASTGIEARRLLFRLLSDPSLSPLLLRGEGQQIARCLVRLLESPNASQDLRRFIISCLNTSPFLVKDIFRMMTIPDPTYCYDYVARIRFVTTVLTEGPSSSLCLAAASTSSTEFTEDNILEVLFPTKLKGRILAKALQNGNSVVRMETFKLIISIVERYKSLLRDDIKVMQSFEEAPSTISSNFAQLLPDCQILIQLQSQFDNTKVSGALLTTYHLRVLEAVVSLPCLSHQDFFDPMKLLLVDASEFDGFLPGVQTKLLKFIRTTIRIRRLDDLMSSKCIIEIMLVTKSAEIHQICFDIVTEMLTRFLLPQESEGELRECLEHESAVWISSLTPATVASFLKLFEKVSIHNVWEQLAFVGKAWKQHNGTRKLHFSLLLVAALCHDDQSPSFARFVGQVVARCMFFLRDPLPLAEVVVHSGNQRQRIARSDFLQPLVDYARSLIGTDAENQLDTVARLGKLLFALFSKDSAFVQIFHSLIGEDEERMRVKRSQPRPLRFSYCASEIPSIRFLIHMYIVSSQRTPCVERFRAVLWNLIPLLQSSVPSFVGESSLNSSVTSDLTAILRNTSAKTFPDSIYLMLCTIFGGVHPFEGRKVELEGLLANHVGRAQLLYVCLVGDNLPVNDRVEPILSLLQESLGGSSDEAVHLASFFFDITFDRVEYGELSLQVWRSILDCWILASKTTAQKDKSCPRKLRCTLTSTICRGLQNGGVNAAALLTLLRMHPAEKVVDLCLESFTDEQLPPSEPGVGLLALVSKTDGSHYHPFSMNHLLTMDDLSRKAWEQGRVDALLAQLIADAEVLSPLLTKLVPLIADRLMREISVLKDSEVSTITVTLMDVVHQSLATLDFSQQDMNDLTFTVDPLLIQLLASHDAKIVTSSTADRVCKLAYGLLSNSSFESHRLVSHFFSFLIVSLPAILKKSSKDFSIGLSSSVALTFLHDLLERSHDFNNDVIARFLKRGVVQKILRVCLKYGVVAPSSMDDTSKMLLRLTARLIRWSSNPRCPLTSIPAPAEVFEMLSTHSKFPLLFSCQFDDPFEASVEETKAAAIELMKCCILTSSEEINIAPHIWKLLFANSLAGSGEIDTVISSFLRSCPSSIQPPLDQLRFRGLCTSGRSDDELDSRSFEWFVRSVSPSRIRATVSRFPFFTTFAHSRSENNEEAINSPGPTEDKIIDTPYNPLCFFPLLLGALEDCLVPNLSPLFPPQFPLTSIATIHRLCDKGVVSFCLIALSSTCETVRLHAVAALGIILQAISSDYASEIASWRSRPQIRMLLDSVQRGLALEKAKGSNVNVPRFLPIVAIFIARAAFVLQRPDDPLYVAINRYFLKSDLNHGGFQDFHRLPAFVSLFCSETGDTQQARAERIWALQNLCDGLTDESSFRLVASCHAPDLILTAFENVRMSSVSKELKGAEFCLLLQSLQAMIDHGGYAAHTHLLRRGGLCPWMASICNSTRYTFDFFPTHKSCVEFCHLVQSVTKVLSNNIQLRTGFVAMEVCGLVGPLHSLCLCSPFGVHRTNALITRVLAALSEICSLLVILKKEEKFSDDVHPMGAPLSSTLGLLKLVKGDMAREDALKISCGLPISFAATPSQEKICEFILFALQCCEHHNARDGGSKSPSMDQSDMLSTLVLRRILVLLEYSAGAATSPLVSGSDILRGIFSMRSHLNFSHPDVEGNWSNCLALLLQSMETKGSPGKDDELQAFISDVLFGGEFVAS